MPATMNERLTRPIRSILIDSTMTTKANTKNKHLNIDKRASAEGVPRFSHRTKSNDLVKHCEKQSRNSSSHYFFQRLGSRLCGATLFPHSFDAKNQTNHFLFACLHLAL